MIGFSLFFILWFISAHLCGGLAIAVALHFSTVFILAVQLDSGWHWLRSSWLARFVGQCLMRVQVGSELMELDPLRQYVFACEPHGPVALHLCFLFAAHGGLTMQEKMARRTVVMGHWLLIFLPFVCQLFQLCGVTFSWRTTVDRALDRVSHLALCPSGMHGKLDSLRRIVEPGTIVVRRRERLGFIALAARRRAVIIPILSPREDDAMTVFNWILLAFGVYSKCDVTMRIGKPIDTGANPAEIETLASLYYENLVLLAGDDYKIKFE